jgi:hypothetical protein
MEKTLLKNKLILTKDIDCYIDYLVDNKLSPREYKYLCEPDQLYGYNGEVIVLDEYFSNNSCILDIIKRKKLKIIYKKSEA